MIMMIKPCDKNDAFECMYLCTNLSALQVMDVLNDIDMDSLIHDYGDPAPLTDNPFSLKYTFYN